MPRTTADIAYERGELGAQLLVDLCDVRVYTWNGDGGGGRTLNDPPVVYAGLGCRLEADRSGIERNDAAGDRIVTDYILQMARTNSVPEGVLLGNGGYYVELKMTSIGGVPVARYFYLISYGETSEIGLRSLYVRELLS
jgi:hypothetical protein